MSQCRDAQVKRLGFDCKDCKLEEEVKVMDACCTQESRCNISRAVFWRSGGDITQREHRGSLIRARSQELKRSDVQQQECSSGSSHK